MDLSNIDEWQAPDLPENIPCGDMPGDSVKIGEKHILKAGVIFPLLIKEMDWRRQRYGQEKFVVSVYGGSGVGKSETASLLSYYLNEAGIGAYTMSGDNYVHRVPKHNDAKRESIYAEGGTEALKAYLGSELETNFKEVNEIIRLFHTGTETIYLKRMGRTEADLWYDPVDFSGIRVLVLEWTHGNNGNLRDVDIPIFLSSTPAETLAHRIARNRDGNPDSPFVRLVLELEQELLTSQVPDARIIISKQGESISAEEYMERINAEQEQ